MKSPGEVLKAQRSLNVWRGTKKAAGVLMIVATVLMIGSAIIALKKEESTYRAMRVPFSLAIILSVLFIRSDKKVLEIEAMLRG